MDIEGDGKRMGHNPYKKNLSEELLRAVDIFIQKNYIPESEESLQQISIIHNECESKIPIPDEDSDALPDLFPNGTDKGDALSELTERSITPEKDSVPELSDLHWDDLDDVLEGTGETFHDKLLQLIDKSGMTDVQVYHKAQIDRKLFSKIRTHQDYRPRKCTVLALALALGLNMDDTKDLLCRAEYALSPGSKADLIVEYCIQNRIFDLFEVNALLYEHGEPTLP
ncbi:MAG: hypothetical protein LIV24_10800 [Eubacterium sp.]|nr:hypothetical protein [Eubacterium sp.]